VPTGGGDTGHAGDGGDAGVLRATVASDIHRLDTALRILDPPARRSIPDRSDRP